MLTSEKCSYYDLFSISVFEIKAEERTNKRNCLAQLSLLILIKLPKVFCHLFYMPQETDQIGLECDFFGAMIILGYVERNCSILDSIYSYFCNYQC